MARYKDVWQRQSETDNPPLPHAAGPLHGGSKRLFIAETNEEASHPLKLFTYDVMPRFT